VSIFTRPFLLLVNGGVCEPRTAQHAKHRSWATQQLATRGRAAQPYHPKPRADTTAHWLTPRPNLGPRQPLGECTILF